MPKAVPVTFGDHLAIQKNLESPDPDLKKFWEASPKERWEILAQMRGSILVEEFGYPSCSGETCFLYRYGKYLVVVWTSCLRKKVFECRRQERSTPPDQLPLHRGEIVSRPSGEDAGRVLILEETKKGKKYPRYFARYVHRTKGFVKNLCRRAWIAAYKISHRPLCRECGKAMDICENAAGGNYWGCFNVAHVEEGIKKPIFEKWHCNLPAKARRMSEALDKAFEKQLEQRRREAKELEKKPPERARDIRARTKAKRAMGI